MKLKTAALLAEIVSGFAIVVTLVVLIFEVRDNTSAVRAATRESIVDRVERITLNVATNADLATLLAGDGGFDELSSTSGADLTSGESLQLRAFITAILRNSEEAYFQVAEGRLDDAYFEGRIQGILRFISFGSGAEIYESQKAAGVYDDEFTRRIDEAIAVSTEICIKDDAGIKLNIEIHRGCGPG